MLTFEELREKNVSRMHRWHGEAEEWTLADWSNAMCGEAGEAANIVKKYRRHETGTRGGPMMAEIDPSKPKQMLDALAKELADVICYVDLLASQADINLEEAVRDKFNEVSARQDFPERL